MSRNFLGVFVLVRLLGSLEVLDGDRDVTPSSSKLREIVALLVLNANKPVQKKLFIDKLWGGNPPATAEATLQTYIYKLRKVGPFRDSGGFENRLVTKASGYQLNLPDECVDVHSFERLLHQAEEMVALDPAQAAELLSEALELWRGPALADVDMGEALSAHAVFFEERRLRAIELQIEVGLKLGRHAELVSKLKELTAVHRFNESFHCNLMVALYRSGRCIEALDVCRGLREVMIEELGIEPSAKIRALQAAMINGDQSLDLLHPAVPAQSQRSLFTPAQLPPPAFDFAGREAELEQIGRYLTADGESRPVVRLVRLSGVEGVGKTELAMEAAQRVAWHFPGGQLVADLRGSAGRPAEPSVVLLEFLEAAGFTPDQIPEAFEGRSKMFRSWTAANPVLLVLDDAASTEQVKALLPGSSRCAVIVTSRQRLCGLGGTGELVLDPLELPDAVSLLCSAAGVDVHGSTEYRRWERLAQDCGRLPLALLSAGAGLSIDGQGPLTDFAGKSLAAS